MTTLQRNASIQLATVAVDGTTSDRLVLDGFSIGTVIVPAEFDGTTLTFTVCDTEGGTYVAYEASDGSAVTITTNANSAFALPEGMMGAKYGKIVCGSAQTTTATVFRVMLKG